mgnify:CR=1 FL=1
MSVVIPQPTAVYRGNLPTYRAQVYPQYYYPRVPTFYPQPYGFYPSPYPYRTYGPVYYPRTRVIVPRTRTRTPFSGTSHYFGNPHASQYIR